VRTKKIISILLAVCLTLGVIAAMDFISVETHADKSSDLRKKINDLEKKKNDIQKKIDAAEKDKNNAKALRDAVNEKIDNIREQIRLIDGRLSTLNGEIKKLDANISETENRVDDTKEQFKQRLRAIYLTGNQTNLRVLLSADDFGDYLTQSEIVKNIAKADKEMLDKLSAEIVKLNEDKKEAEAKREDVKGLKEEQVSKKRELDKQYNTYQQQLNAAENAEESHILEKKKTADEIAKAEKELQRELDRIRPPSNVDPIYFSGTFAWPVPSCYNISSHYGPRWGTMHRGIDISGGGISGKAVVAAADGIVGRADWWGGYGNCIMINHGYMDGSYYQTVYGHLSGFAVSTGQAVTKGQTIGYVGSTGDSTGPHLHFEIRVNSNAVNPLSFFSGG